VGEEHSGETARGEQNPGESDETPGAAEAAGSEGGEDPPAAHGEMGDHGMKDLAWLMVGEALDTEVGEVTFAGVTMSSGLGIRRDPGVPLVWIGFIACLAGMALIFYLPLQRKLIIVRPAGKAASIVTVRRLPPTRSAADSSGEDWARLLAAQGSPQGRPQGDVAGGSDE
jgi:hypothetical protein